MIVEDPEDDWSEEDLIILGRWLARLVAESDVHLHAYQEAVAYEAGRGSCANRQDVMILLKLMSGVPESIRRN